MSIRRRAALVRRRLGFGPLAAALLLPGLANAAAIDLYYQRTVMSAADQRCRLFTPELASALASAQAQARNAALREGVAMAAVDATGQRARAKVAATPCTSPDIAKAAERVRSGFDAYSRLERMNFPGEFGDWLAVRDISRRQAIWRLSQSARFGWDSLTFGLAGRDQTSALVATASFADEAEPYAARLVFRDPVLAPAPFINVLRAGAGGKTPLSARMPPRSATLSVLAEARSDADPSLLPPGAASGVAFRFPAAAADALAQLDPREAVAIEFQFADGARDGVRTAYVEVGDFAAGRAFLAAAQR